MGWLMTTSCFLLPLSGQLMRIRDLSEGYPCSRASFFFFFVHKVIPGTGISPLSTASL